MCMHYLDSVCQVFEHLVLKCLVSTLCGPMKHKVGQITWGEPGRRGINDSFARARIVYQAVEEFTRVYQTWGCGFKRVCTRH